MYLVLIDRRTFRGSNCDKNINVILATNNEKKAVATARGSSELGYTLYQEDYANIEVIRICVDHPYQAQGDPIDHQVIVYSLTKPVNSGNWKEEWPDTKFKKAFEGKPETERAVA